LAYHFSMTSARTRFGQTSMPLLDIADGVRLRPSP
jgi:hypothetical protein